MGARILHKPSRQCNLLGGILQRQRLDCRVLAHQSTKIRTGYWPTSEALEVLRGQLAIDHDDVIAKARLHQMRKRHLRCVALAAEHRFAEEDASQAHPVQAADERSLPIRLNAVRVAAFM